MGKAGKAETKNESRGINLENSSNVDKRRDSKPIDDIDGYCLVIQVAERLKMSVLDVWNMSAYEYVKYLHALERIDSKLEQDNEDNETIPSIEDEKRFNKAMAKRYRK